MAQIESIPSIMNGCVDLLALESSVDMSYLIDGENADPVGMIRARCKDLVKYLEGTNRAVRAVNRVENQGDIRWIYYGRREIFTVYKSVGVLEYMMVQIAERFGADLKPEERTVVDHVRELNLKLKVMVSGLQAKMEIANQYHEIQECVLKSIDQELEGFGSSFAALEADLESVIKNKAVQEMDFTSIRLKLRECELFSLNRNVRFVALNEEELAGFNKFVELEKRLNHTIAALKYVPNTIEMFLNNAKHHYPNEVLEFVERYTAMVRTASQVRIQSSSLQNKFITSRMNDVFQRVLDLITGLLGEEDKKTQIMEMISLLNSIKDMCCISSDQRQKLGLASSRFSSGDEVINYRPQSRLNRRVFSNPTLGESTIANAATTEEFNEEIKLVEMIRLEASELAKDQESTNKLRNLVANLAELEIPASPSYTPSSVSSPEHIHAQDIFDADPFVTPGYRRRCSKIPVISPSTTPKSSQGLKTPTSMPLLNFKEIKVIRKPERQSQIPLPTRPESLQDIIRARKRSPAKLPTFKTEPMEILEQRATVMSLPRGRPRGYRITTL